MDSDSDDDLMPIPVIRKAAKAKKSMPVTDKLAELKEKLRLKKLKEEQKLEFQESKDKEAELEKEIKLGSELLARQRQEEEIEEVIYLYFI